MASEKIQSLVKFYFSFEKRATRYDFNIRFALVALLGSFVAYGLDCLRYGSVIIEKDGSFLFSNLFGCVAAISFFAVTCRRLHDMNYSGWWQVPVHLVPVGILGILMVCARLALLHPLTAWLSGLAAMALTFVFYLVFFIFLSAKRGTIGPNRFGPDPLQLTETV